MSREGSNSKEPKAEAVARQAREANRRLREARAKLSGRVLPPDEPPFCSFCGAGQNNVRSMLGGQATAREAAFICSECVEAFHARRG
jgi:hypothetical protein